MAVPRGTAAVALPVAQRTPEWLAARRDGIGASEAAAALGLSRWESPVSLWARKLGLVPDEADNVPMRVGAVIEPLLADLYAERTGTRIRRANRLLRSRAHPFMLASLDRRAGDRLVELKWSGRGDGYGEPGTDEVPDEVLAQVVHQMAVTGASAVDVAVLVVARYDFRIYTIARDLEAEAALIDGEREFWRHVEERSEPPVDGSAATRAALAELYPRDNGEDLEADAEVAGAMAQLRAVRSQLEDLEEARGEFENRIKAALGEATALVAPGVGRVTWKAAKPSASTDWKAVAAQIRDQVGLDETSWETAVHLATTTKPGSRRFVPRWDQEETHG